MEKSKTSSNVDSPSMLNTGKLILYYLLFALAYFATYLAMGGQLIDDRDVIPWREIFASSHSLSITEKIMYVVWYIPQFPVDMIIGHSQGEGIRSLAISATINPMIVASTLLAIYWRNRATVVQYANWINAFVVVLMTTIFVVSAEFL